MLTDKCINIYIITPSLKAVRYQWQSTNEADRKQEMNPTKNKLTWSLLSEACAACKADEASESSTGSLRKFNEFPTFAYLRCFEAECKSKTKLALVNTNQTLWGDHCPTIITNSTSKKIALGQPDSIQIQKIHSAPLTIPRLQMTLQVS